MNRFLNSLFPLALAAGLAGIAGAALAAARHHPVALAMTLLIAAFFALGVWELRTFLRAGRELDAALATPADEGWIARVPPSLRTTVQQRLEGQRAALPGLALAPALAGLLVLLGMLGTFIGLVITLGGTAQAVSATADLAALRSALGAPVQGLGLAFSASVAGVCGSAMLGLMVALARRERAAASSRLDAALIGPLLPLTAAHRRSIEQRAAAADAAEAQQRQQQSLVSQLQQYAQQLADQLAAQNERFHRAQADEQAQFHSQAREAYQALAASVDQTLRTSLVESAAQAGAAIRPAAEAAMAGIAREAAALHERVGDRVAVQLGELSARFEAGAVQIAQQAEAGARAQAEALARQQDAAQQAAADTAQHFAAQTQALLDRVSDAQARQQAAHAELEGQRHAAALAASEALARQREANEQLLAAHRDAAQQLFTASGERAQTLLTELTAAFAAQTRAAVDAIAGAHHQLLSTHSAGDAERLTAWCRELEAAGGTQLAQQQQLADALLQNTRALVDQGQAQAQAALAEAGALLKAAGEAPRAAVEVVAALREQLAQSQAQDRAALAERAELMQTVSTLLASLQQAAGEQRASLDALIASASAQVDAMVHSSATQLDVLGQRFAAQADATGQTLAQAATTLAASAAEMGSLGEGFGAAVEQFQGANVQLVQHLVALEERLSGAMTRSDEQMGYYVAQAREVIDLCLGSQKQVLDALQAVPRG